MILNRGYSITGLTNDNSERIIDIDQVEQLCEKYPPLKQVYEQFAILYAFYKSEEDHE